LPHDPPMIINRPARAGPPLSMAVLWLALLLVAAFPAAAANPVSQPSSQPTDQDWARDAVRAGSLRPLTEILGRLEKEFDGQVVEIELERQGNRLVYEIEMLSLKGHLIELVYDARNGALVSVHGRGLEAARREASPLTGVRP
jgi:hypothetical protein